MIAAAEARLIAIALALLALAAAVWYVVHNERRIGAEREHAAVAAERQAAKSAADEADARARSAQKEIADETQRMQARADGDHLAAADAAQRLLDAAREDSRRARVAAAAASAPACDADLVPADLLRSALDEAVRLAAIADQRGIAGSACERAYSALSP